MIAPKTAALAAVVACVSIALADTWTSPAPAAPGQAAVATATAATTAAANTVQPVDLVQRRLAAPASSTAPDRLAALSAGGGPGSSLLTGAGSNLAGGLLADGSPGTVGSPGTAGSVRGLARAVREATLSTRMASRIIELPLADGVSFKAGALLVKFDCERQTAEARAASAAAEAQKKMVETNEELDKFESIGKNDLAISRSQLDKARAEAEALKSQLKDCSLYAPFGGRVVERLVHNFEAVAANQPLLKVVDTSELEIELIVPSAWLQWLAEGASFQFRIDETGQTVAGNVTRLTPTVDPVSKTTKVIARLQPGKGVGQVLPGMSGSALFSRFAPGARQPALAKAGANTAKPKPKPKPTPAKLAAKPAAKPATRPGSTAAGHGKAKTPVAAARRPGPAVARG